MLMTLSIEASFLTSKLLKQLNRYHKLRKAFSEFFHRHSVFYVFFFYLFDLILDVTSTILQL